MFGHKEKPRRSGAKCKRVFAEEGVLVFRKRAIPSAGIGSFGENARHRSVAAEQQIGRHRHPTYDHLSSPRFIGMNPEKMRRLQRLLVGAGKRTTRRDRAAAGVASATSRAMAMMVASFMAALACCCAALP